MIDLANDVPEVPLAPRCAGCGEPGASFCFACRDLCEPRSHEGRVPLRVAGACAGPPRAAIHRLKYGVERGLADVGDVFVAEAGAVALADDVATTGATLADVAAAGTRSVHAYVVAVDE